MITAGYAGMFISAFLAATILPFSSDVVFIGLLQTELNPVLLFAVASVGNTLGGMTSYWIGWLGKWEWLTKYFRVSKAQVYRWRNATQRWSAFLAFLGWVPFVGDVLIIALGYFKTNWKTTFIFMAFGKCLRYAALLYFSEGIKW